MLWALVAAAGLVAAQSSSFYFVLDNRLDQYLSYSHVVTYRSPASKECVKAAQIPTPFHDDRAVRENQCNLKCMRNGTAHGCGGDRDLLGQSYVSAADNGYYGYCTANPDDVMCGSGTNLLCLSVSQLKQMCNSVSDCASFTVYDFNTGSGGYAFIAGELNYATCTGDLKVNSNRGKLYEKQTDADYGDRADCPLGIGLEVTGGLASMQGLYEAVLPANYPTTNPSTYEHVSNNNKVIWKTSTAAGAGCGFVGLRYNATAAPVVTPITCKDNDDVANWLFLQCGGDIETCENHTDYEKDWCSKAVTIWGGSYCVNNIFARICAKSCERHCVGNDDSAAGQYFLHLGLGNMEAADAAGGVNAAFFGCPMLAGSSFIECDDPVVPILCPEQPPARHCRTRERQLTPAFRLPRGLASLRAELRAVGSKRERRLDWRVEGVGESASVYEEVFATYDGLSCTGPLSAPDRSLFLTAQIFDVRAHLAPSGVTFNHQCDSRPAYRSGAYRAAARRRNEIGRTGQFCQNRNLDITFSTNARLVNDLCYVKCGSRTVDSASPGDSGQSLLENDWCSGNDELYGRDTMALCLPREKCEEYCTQEAGCHSIDMHRYFPRCYLNSYDCSLDDMDSSFNPMVFDVAFDFLQKEVTPTAATGPTEDSQRVTYATLTGLNCTPGAVKYVPTDVEVASSNCYTSGCDRKDCEDECTDHATCVGFQFVEDCPMSPNVTATTNDYNARECNPTSGTCMLFTAVTKAQCEHATVRWAANQDLRERARTMYVEKYAPALCNVTVEGDFFYRGIYTREVGEAQNFVKRNNKSRITFSNPGSSYGISQGYECYGWVLQKNMKPPVEVHLRNCTDKTKAAGIYLAANATVAAEIQTSDGEIDFGCEWGALKGHCYDVVFANLCPLSCLPISRYDIANRTYYAQYETDTLESTFVKNYFYDAFLKVMYDIDVASGRFTSTWATFLDRVNRNLYALLNGFPTSFCTDQDNDFAMYYLRNQDLPALPLADAVMPASVAAECGGDAENIYMICACKATAALPSGPCFTSAISAVIWALCPQACAAATPPPGVVVADPDEAQPSGAQDRRLQVGFYYVEKPERVTTNAREINVTYIDYDTSDEFWTNEYMTWNAGAHDPDSPVTGAYWTWEGSLVQGTNVCLYAEGTRISIAGNDGGQLYDLLHTNDVYSKAMPESTDIAVAPVCREATLCPRTTTCVLNEQRFQDELAIIKGPVSHGAFISEMDKPEKDALFSRMEPKILLSLDRAEAILDAYELPSVTSISRAGEIGAISMTVLPLKSEMARTVVISMVPNSGLSMKELGRKYNNLPSGFYENWASDIIRIERFDEVGNPVKDGAFTFQLYAPEIVSEKLVLFMYGPVIGSEPVEVNEMKGATVTKLADPFVWEVTLPSVNADFIATEDKDECKESPCGENQQCTNLLGAGYSCACAFGYVQVEDACRTPNQAYNAADEDYYIRIAHTERLDYGWHVKEVYLYSDEGCSVQLDYKNVRSVNPFGGGTIHPAEEILDSRWWIEVARGYYAYVFTGLPPHYDDKTNFALIDDVDTTTWWSACLNCNPDPVDATHGGPAEIVLAIEGNVQVGCVRVIQEPAYATRGVVVERGPVKGPGCGLLMSEPRCKPTMAWSRDDLIVGAELANGGENVPVPLTCGIRGVEHYGELIISENPKIGSIISVYGTGSVAVPSSCHCHELCIKAAEKGCTNYKYDLSSSECTLMSNLGGVLSAELMVSGSPAQRGLSYVDDKPVFAETPLVAAFTTSAVPGTGPFSLTVSGVGFPYSKTKAEDASEFQRIKIVLASQTCAEKMPDAVQGLGCSETVRVYGARKVTAFTICSPRPALTGMAATTFGPIEVKAGDSAEDYAVCYCSGKCGDPKRWEKIGTGFSVAKASFTWKASTDTLYRKATGGPVEFELAVTRPPFETFSDASGWRLKLVRDHFDCNVLQGDGFSCTALGGIAPSGLPGAPQLAVAGSFKDIAGASFLHFNATVNRTLAMDEAIALAFDAPVTKSGCSGVWYVTDGPGLTVTEIPCADAIAADDESLARSVVLLDVATLTGPRLKVAWTAGVVSDVTGYAVEAGEYPEFLEVQARPAGEPTAIVTVPADGDLSFVGSAVEVYYNAPVQLNSSALVTLTDCGVDDVCGTSDDSAEPAGVTAAGRKLSIDPTGALIAGRKYLVGIEELAVKSTTAPAVVANESVVFSFTFGCLGPTLVTGPDIASWSLSVNIALEDVGAYSVCFKEKDGAPFQTIPSTKGELTMSILPLGADSTASRGVFYTQRYSAAANAAYDQTFLVAGRKLVTSKAKKIALSQSTSCDPSVAKFVSTVSPAAKADTTPPTVESVFDEMVAKYATAGSYLVAIPAYITIDFSEPVTVDGCIGNVTIMKEVTAGQVEVVGGIDCATGVVENHKVRYKNTNAMEMDAVANGNVGEYFVELEYGNVLDLAGNKVARTSFTTASKRVFQSTTDPQSALSVRLVAFTETLNPALVFSEPLSGGAIVPDLTQVPYNLTMTLGFTTEIFFDSTKSILVKDCGATLVCDAVTDAGESVDQITVDYSDVTFNLPPKAAAVALGTSGAAPLRRFVLEVEVGAFAGPATGGGASTTGLSSAMSIEFSVDATGFSVASALTADTGKSTSEKLAFSARFGALESGQYSACYCDDLSDTTLADLEDGETTYSVVDDQLLTRLAGAENMTATGAFAGYPSVGAHECVAKCSTGCVGPQCYCEGMAAGITALCLPPALCMDACDLLGTACAAVSVHHSLPLCLIGDVATPTVLREEWDTLVSRTGTACTDAQDFQTYAGLLTVTDRVDLDIDYVVEPEKDMSIEVTSVPGGLTKGLVSTDRIMVIDDLGACGLSGPSKAVALPGNDTWSSFYPRSLFFDGPAEDEEDPHKPVAGVQHLDYNVVPASYCAEENLDLAAYTVPLSGLMKSAATHSCHAKCSAECTEKDPANCYCSGYFTGFDTEKSNAICGDVHLCEYICNNIEDCASVDMHASLPRCFLNTGCATQKISGEYGIRIKATRARRTKDLGYSHGQLLRFEPLTFTTGGTFKLCFCDSALLATGRTCSATADFSVQVGTVHSSGVSCLLREPKLQSVDCVQQFHGGMRCYGSQPVPDIDIYELQASYFGPDTPAPTPATISTYCLMMPQEVRASDPVCKHSGIP